MKRFLIVIMVLISLPILGNAQKINWMTMQEAVELNKTTPKKIFIDVYTGWCGWCKKMDQTTFTNQEVVDYINANYYAVKLDAEMSDTIVFRGYTYVNQGGMNGRKGTHQFAAALLQGKMSYPSYVFMNEDLQLLTVAPGYRGASEFLPLLKYFGSDAYLNEKYNDFLNKQ